MSETMKDLDGLRQEVEKLCSLVDQVAGGAGETTKTLALVERGRERRERRLQAACAALTGLLSGYDYDWGAPGLRAHERHSRSPRRRLAVAAGGEAMSLEQGWTPRDKDFMITEKEALEAYDALARVFIEKVETGRAHSEQAYREMLRILERRRS